jgi:predicted ATPase/class 3 adenylate cyclase
MNLPTGTVTFLFTDIEGSTRLWEQYPDSMRLALARHDEIAASIVTKFRGALVKSRGEGDSLFAVFALATDAVEAATALQLAYTREAWPESLPLEIRMALHTGEADERDGDYYGPAVNRCARLRAIAHGGQILLSSATQEIAQDTLADGVTLHSCGLHRLKDLGRPESVYQLRHAALPADFPPLRSLDNADLPNNLPPQLTSFIGREKELAEIRRLFAATRLLTLTGAGGCGKTRLALQVAADLLDDSPGGVWLVELAALTDGAMVVQAAASALSIREVPGQPVLQTVIDYLKTRQMILVLDNCEHLLGACAEIAGAILRHCPGVSLLATSREGLGVAGEQTYRVPSMSLPDPVQPQTPESLCQSESARLFVERAGQGQPDFHVTPQNTAVLASICRRLDGIPLAIELAAARVRALSLEEINSKLDQRFRLLTGGSRTALPRQQTLRSLIDWSYVLLNLQEQMLMQRVSVFSGGWTLEAAEAVCSGDGIEEWEVLDLLSSVVDKSLVIVDFGGKVARYRLLETVRQYARDRLLEREDAHECRNRHLAYYLNLAERVAPNLTGPDQLEWLATLDPEYENLRAALEWSLDLPDDGAMAVRMGASLWPYWNMRHRRSEGRPLLAAVLARSAASAMSTASAVTALGAGVLAWYQGDLVESQSRSEQSLATFNLLGDQVGVARALNALGNVKNSGGDLDGALACHEEALAIRRNLGDLGGVSQSLNNVATVYVARGDFQAAQRYLQESLAIIRERGNPWAVAIALVNLGEVACELGDLQASRAYFVECLAKTLELGWRGNPFLLESLTILALAESRPDVAVSLFGAAERVREVVEMPLTPSEQERVEAGIAVARATLNDDAAFEAAWQKGRTMTTEQAAQLVLGKSPDA